MELWSVPDSDLTVEKRISTAYDPDVLNNSFNAKASGKVRISMRSIASPRTSFKVPALEESDQEDDSLEDDPVGVFDQRTAYVADKSEESVLTVEECLKLYSGNWTKIIRNHSEFHSVQAEPDVPCDVYEGDPASLSPTHRVSRADVSEIQELDRRVPLFRLYQPFYQWDGGLESRLCGRVDGAPLTERSRIFFSVGMDNLTIPSIREVAGLGGEGEDLFLNMFLMDANQGVRLSENFYMELTPKERDLGKSDVQQFQYYDESAQRRRPVFSVSEANGDIVLVVRLYRTLRGEVWGGEGGLFKSVLGHVRELQRSQRNRSSGSRVGEEDSFKQALLWAKVPVFDAQGRFCMPPNIRTWYKQRVAVSDEDMKSLFAEADNAKSTKIKKLHNTMCDTNPQLHSPHVSIVKDDGLRSMGEDMEMGRSIAIEPIPVSVGQPILEFHNGEIEQPVMIPLNFLYVYPKTVSFQHNRNIAVRVQLRDNDRSVEDAAMEAVLLESPEEGAPLWGESGFTEASYHSTMPSFSDEIKVRLPSQLHKKHHLLFTFYHVRVKKKGESAAPSTLIGHCVYPLLSEEDGQVILDDTEHCVYIVNELPSEYMADDKEMNFVDGKRAVFRFKSRLQSTIIPQDRTISKFFSIHNRIRLTEWARDEEDLKAVHRSLRPQILTRQDTVQFFPVILNLLLRTMSTTSASEELSNSSFVGLLSFLSSLMTAVDLRKPFERQELLMSYVSYNFDDSVDPEGCLYLTLFRHWVNILKEKSAEEAMEPAADDRPSMDQRLTPPKPTQAIVSSKGSGYSLARGGAANRARTGSMARFEVGTERSSMTLSSRFDTSAFNENSRTQSVRFSWFLFDLIIKSMALASRNGSLSADRANTCLKLSQELLELTHAEMVERCTSGLTLARALNKHFALFIRDLLPLLDCDGVMRLAADYARRTGANDSPAQRELKVDFIRIVTDHEHYVPLSLLDVNDRLCSLLLDEVGSCLALASQNKAPQAMHLVIAAFAEMLAKHDFDRRYQSEDARMKVAQMYFPLVEMLIKGGGEGGQFSYDKDDTKKGVLISFLYVIKGATTDFNQWLLGQDRATLLTVLQTLRDCITCFRYSGPEGKSPTSSILHHSMLEVGEQKSTKKQLEHMFMSIPSGAEVSSRMARTRSRGTSAVNTSNSNLDLAASAVSQAPNMPGERTSRVVDAMALSGMLASANAGPGNKRDFKAMMVDRSALNQPKLKTLTQEELNEIVRYEGKLVTEVSWTVLDILSYMMTEVRGLSKENGPVDMKLFRSVFDTMLCMLQQHQSERLFPNMSIVMVQMFETFKDILFGDDMTFIESLLDRLLAVANYNNPIIRTTTVTLIYELFSLNFTERKNVNRVRVQCSSTLYHMLRDDVKKHKVLKMDLYTSLVVSLKDLVFMAQEELNEKEGRRPSIENMKFFFTKKASASIDATRSFIQALESSSNQLRDIINLTVALSVLELTAQPGMIDFEDMADLYLMLSHAYTDIPVRQLHYIGKLALWHMYRGNKVEAAMCRVHMASITAGVMYIRKPNREFVWQFGRMDLSLPDVPDHAALEGQSKDDILVDEAIESNLLAAIKILRKESVYWLVNDVYKVLMPLYESQRDFKRLRVCALDLQDMFDRMRVVNCQATQNPYNPHNCDLDMFAYYMVCYYPPDSEGGNLAREMEQSFSVRPKMGEICVMYVYKEERKLTRVEASNKFKKMVVAAETRMRQNPYDEVPENNRRMSTASDSAKTGPALAERTEASLSVAEVDLKIRVTTDPAHINQVLSKKKTKREYDLYVLEVVPVPDDIRVQKENLSIACSLGRFAVCDTYEQSPKPAEETFVPPPSADKGMSQRSRKAATSMATDVSMSTVADNKREVHKERNVVTFPPVMNPPVIMTLKRSFPSLTTRVPIETIVRQDSS